MYVPFLDLGSAYRELKPEIDSSIKRVLDSGWYILGEEVDSFEKNFAEYTSSKYCLGVANGMDALEISLRALDIGPGDEVIVPSHTFIATWLAVTKVGAIPIAVEPDPLTYNIDVSKIEKKINKKTKAIIPVHLYGQPASMKEIMHLKRKYSLHIIEDAAQAQGSIYKGKRIGSHGDIVCWSFYPGKNLGAKGDAGAVTSDDAALIEKIKYLRNYGSRQKYEHRYAGMNSRMDPIQACILNVKLDVLDEWNSRRTSIASKYLSDLINIPDLKLPFVSIDVTSVWHLFVISCDRRDELHDFLEANKIETLIHYPTPPHMQEVYRHSMSDLKLEIAESISKKILSLPIGPHLEDSQVNHVIDKIKLFFER